MPAPSLTERVDELRRELAELREIVVREETRNQLKHGAGRRKLADLGTLSGKLSDKLAAVETKTHEVVSRITGLEERVKTLEKSGDRTWQVWLALGGSVTALLIALLKK